MWKKYSIKPSGIILYVSLLNLIHSEQVSFFKFTINISEVGMHLIIYGISDLMT